MPAPASFKRMRRNCKIFYKSRPVRVMVAVSASTEGPEMDFETDYLQALRALFPHYGQTLPAGTRFIQEGDTSTKVYFLITGLAAVFIGEDPNEHMLWLLEAGDFVGELALLDNLPRSASVETLEETHVLILDS